ncbi:effector binding domain-containing protein [Cohnella nanjingensis]|uniref:Effector binding domain-containing protein n=1 Tax=Cohnella nanjingensis TaxID=1387779 RepID=A0A7X0RP30_9BACL|nr:effector binding domain-containing protein [Cohnella nanjingensis]MBB6671054.1 effector binding domain-containing protein [Cohnella nanjingensis]
MISTAYPGIVAAEVRQLPQLTFVGGEIEIERPRVVPEQAIPALWEAQMRRIRERIGPDGAFPVTYGLYRYEPPFGPGQDFLYLASIEARGDADEPDGWIRRTVPAGAYAAVTYRGAQNGMMQIWDFFHREWLPANPAYEAVDDYEFERFDARFQGTHSPDSVFEFYFPIRERKQAAQLTEKTVYDAKGNHILQDLRETNVRMVSFQGANLHGIDLRDASLRHVNFVGSRWEHIYFANAHVNETQLGGTVFEHIRRPAAAQSMLEEEPGTDDWVNVEPVTFRDSDLGTAIFDRCDLSDVEIRDCRIDGLRIDGILLTELLERYRRDGK